MDLLCQPPALAKEPWAGYFSPANPAPFQYQLYPI